MESGSFLVYDNTMIYSDLITPASSCLIFIFLPNVDLVLPTIFFRPIVAILEIWESFLLYMSFTALVEALRHKVDVKKKLTWFMLINSFYTRE